MPIIVLLLLAAIGLAVFWNPNLMLFQALSATEFMQEIAPLFLAALFVERAVEVFITPRRDGKGKTLKATHEKAKAALEAGSGTKDEVIKAQEALDEHRAETARQAFAIAVGLGLALAVVGVRVLETFADASVFEQLASSQQRAFRATDVVISGAVLGGGADGLHKIVKRFLDFVEKKGP